MAETPETRICQICQAPFRPTRATHVHCGAECRKFANDPARERRREYDGEGDAINITEQIFHRQRWTYDTIERLAGELERIVRDNGGERLITKPCAACKREFIIRQKGALTCSKACAAAHRAAVREFQCE